MRRIDGIGKSVDVRSFVRAVVLGGDEGEALLGRVGLVGDLVTLLVDVEIRGSGSVKIAEVVEAIAGVDLPHRARTFMMSMTFSPDGGTLLTGGLGSVGATLAGVMLLGLIFNVLNFENGRGFISLSAYWQSVIRGAFLLVVVIMQSQLTDRADREGAP